MKHALPRLTYANVMSSLAVFLVLAGGTALAAGLAKNSVGPKQLKKGAVTTAKIKDNAIKAGKIAPGAVTGGAINVATLPTVPSATNAQNLNGLHFAVVESNGTVIRSTPGVTAQQTGTGSYLVSLPGVANVSSCFYTGSLGGNGFGVVAGQISFNNGAPPNQNAIFVVTQDSAAAPANKEFTLMARC